MSPQQTSLWLTRIPDERRFPTLEGDHRAEVVVVGSGITGLSAAYFLARAGKRVAVLEANRLGTGETGFTTAFLVSSVDTPFTVLRDRFGLDHARNIWSIGEAAIRTVEEVVAAEDLRCDFVRQDAVALGFSEADLRSMADEADALHTAGGAPSVLDVGAARDVYGLGGLRGAVRVPNQAAFDVRAYLLGLAASITKRGGEIFEASRVTNLEFGDPLRVTTRGGAITAERAVLATGLFPNPYRTENTIFAPMVTYVIALGLDPPAVNAPHASGNPWGLPDTLAWDQEDPFHYLRFVHAPGSTTGDQPLPTTASLLLVGGEDRPLTDAGRAGREPLKKLEAFARTRTPAHAWSVTHAWSGRVFYTPDALPLAGVPPHGDPRVLLVSGLGGNGMTFGTATAQAVANLLTGALSSEDNPFRFDRETLARVPRTP